jgi:hypothetical protein
MTAATMALAELTEKGADIDVLRQMVQFMAQRLMELDVESCCGAGYDEKTLDTMARGWGARVGCCAVLPRPDLPRIGLLQPLNMASRSTSSVAASSFMPFSMWFRCSSISRSAREPSRRAMASMICECSSARQLVEVGAS